MTGGRGRTKVTYQTPNFPVLGKTAKEVAVRRSNGLNWTSCRLRLELPVKRNVHIVRMQLYGVTYFISVTVHEIKHENITRHEKKHENMTHDPSNHLIILHRNFVALKRSWHFSFYLTLLSSVF